MLVEKGTAITAINRELVYFADIGNNTVNEVALNMTPTHLTAAVLRQLDLPVQSIPASLAILNNTYIIFRYKYL